VSDGGALPPEEKLKRKWIPRETWRQEKAVVFARDAIVGPHQFIAHDRAKASGPRSHLWQAKRGVRKGTPDTQLILPDGRTLFFEFKAPGKKVEEDDDQGRMLASLQSMGHPCAWGVTIEELRRFYAAHGVPLVANAEYRAMVLDGLVDSRIAKAEGKMPGTKKAARSPRSAPRAMASKGFVKRATNRGILF
jgi:hypothetical protein